MKNKCAREVKEVTVELSRNDREAGNKIRLGNFEIEKGIKIVRRFLQRIEAAFIRIALAANKKHSYQDPLIAKLERIAEKMGNER